MFIVISLSINKILGQHNSSMSIFHIEELKSGKICTIHKTSSPCQAQQSITQEPLSSMQGRLCFLP